MELRVKPERSREAGSATRVSQEIRREVHCEPAFSCSAARASQREVGRHMQLVASGLIHS